MPSPMVGFQTSACDKLERMADSTPNTPEASAETDLSGRQLGDFRLLRRLGRGAMAEVYLAEQGSLRRQVAVKVLKSELAKDETYVRRFHNEAQAAASLIHANIVQIYDVGSVDGIHYIAQEYVQGQNLQELMVRRGPPALKQAAAIMCQVAAALYKASTAGIVHRDIKPENIMLARSGEVKVADFGLARLTGDAAHLTQVGVTMGTPLYMSPEQVEGRALDPRSDIYSFGVTCYQMLAGTLPFRGETALSVAVQHVNSQAEPLESQRPDLPPALCRIVHKMLAKEPSKRYANARELLTELRALQLPGSEDWAESLADLEGADGFDETLAARLAATGRLQAVMRTSAIQAAGSRKRWLWFFAAAVAAFIAGGVISWLTRPEFLLSGAPRANVAKMNSAHDQLVFAKISGSEEWLKSVEEFWPEAEHEILMARQDLARRYLYQDRQTEAMELFRKFAESDDPELRAFGLAGQSVVLARQGKHQESAEALAKLWPLHEKLDFAMRRMILAALQADQQASRREHSRETEAMLERWRESEFDLQGDEE
jgi:serine/threonine-protein kinase